MPGIPVYHGYIPPGYEIMIISKIKTYLTKYFQLESFVGFGLEFKGYDDAAFKTIKLTWDQPIQRSTHRRHKRIHSKKTKIIA